MTALKEHLLIWPALIVLGSLLISILYGIHSVLPKEGMYDCSIAEISPDYTPAMKDECRKKLRSVK
jgi:hypothetical protein